MTLRAAPKFLIVLLSSLVTIHSTAQVDSALYRVTALKLPTLKEGIEAFYSPGYEARARQIQSNMQGALSFFKMKFGAVPEIRIAVLTKTHWDQVSRVPYDVPNISNPPYLICLPADFGKGVATADWSKTLSMLKPEILEKLRAAGYSYEQAGIKNIDQIGYHELGHALAEKLEIVFSPGKPNSWYSEFVATYFATVYVNASDPAFNEISRMMTENFLEVTPKQTYSTLEDFERLYFRVGPQNYGWYQMKFGMLAEQVYGSKGSTFIDELRSSKFPKNEKLPVDVLLQHLEQIYPGFINWSKRL